MRLRNVKNKKEIMALSPYLIDDKKSHKGNWKKLFNNDNPIHIEIGMGKGKFIIENAKRYKDINFIGIEKYDSIVARALQKIDEDLENLRFIRFNALDIDTIFDKEIDCIYLNFSDPWPKNRHSDRRLTSKIFLDKYDAIFRKGKKIHMKTDNQSLFEYSLESLSKHGYVLEKVSLNLTSSDIENNITTEYEERFIKENKPVYYLIAKK